MSEDEGVDFAEYAPEVGPDPWPDVSVRSLQEVDNPEVAELLAQREGLAITDGLGRVTGWGDSEHRFVLVAERAGQILGYGKCDFLEPSIKGGDAPSGWYLAGVVVAPHARRHGVGNMLTRERLRLLRDRTPVVWYFANLNNPATIALHERLGFVEQTRDFRIPGVTFAGGRGALFRLELTTQAP